MQKQEPSTLNVILIPLWLEATLKAHSLSLDTVLDAEKLSSILSPSDLEKNYRAQYGFKSYWLDTGEAVATRDETHEERTASKLSYLYGELHDAGCNPDPAFKVCRIGYDTIAVTVDPTGKFSSKDLMELIVAEWRATNPLERLAQHPLFARYLQLL